MADFVYVATAGQVGPVHTAALLALEQAIWCPPPGTSGGGWHVQTHPVAGDRIWLVWRLSPGVNPIVLGGGQAMQAPRNVQGTVNLLWETVDHAGLNPTAVSLGYTRLGG